MSLDTKSLADYVDAACQAFENWSHRTSHRSLEIRRVYEKTVAEYEAATIRVMQQALLRKASCTVDRDRKLTFFLPVSQVPQILPASGEPVGECNRLNSFKPFRKLPLEIRRMIWSLASYHRPAQFLPLVWDPNLRANSSYYIPPILHVSQESRKEGLRVYKIIELYSGLAFSAKRASVFINPEVDTAWLCGPPSEERRASWVKPYSAPSGFALDDLTSRSQSQESSAAPSLYYLPFYYEQLAALGIKNIAIGEDVWEQAVWKPVLLDNHRKDLMVVLGKLLATPSGRLTIIRDRCGYRSWSAGLGPEVALHILGRGSTPAFTWRHKVVERLARRLERRCARLGWVIRTEIVYGDLW
ncbi:unnamed protein product [Diplocarpon coronariae]